VTVLWTRRRERPPAESTASEPAPAPATLLDAIQSERAHLLERLRTYEAREQQITERRREVPLDQAEAGEQATEAEFTEELAELAVRRLRGLEHAIERAESGKLGHCEGCGGSIPAARLRALPGTTLCIRCARRNETGGASR
jgi:RNA polymerase-binding transcription factor DksA